MKMLVDIRSIDQWQQRQLTNEVVNNYTAFPSNFCCYPLFLDIIISHFPNISTLVIRIDKIAN